MRVAKLLLTLARLPLLAMLMLFAAIGMAQAGYGEQSYPLLAAVLLTVAGWLLSAAALNDLADEAIDRINLLDAKSRLLITEEASRRDLAMVAGVGAISSLGVAAWLNWRVALVVALGLLFSVAYSLPPVRLSVRGGLASVTLPLGYVAVPFLIGTFSVSTSLTWEVKVLLSSLYVAFIGRILLKDFRDVEGDAMFGKQTFLLRHGRQVTCLVSAVCITTGSASIFLVVPVGSALLPAFLIFAASIIFFLFKLANSLDRKAEAAIVSSIAMMGRGMLLALLAYISMVDLSFSLGRQLLVMAMLTVLFLRVGFLIFSRWNEMAFQTPSPFAGERSRPNPAEPGIKRPFA